MRQSQRGNNHIAISLKIYTEEVSTSFNGFNGNAAMKDIFNFTLVKADTEQARSLKIPETVFSVQLLGEPSTAVQRMKEFKSFIQALKNKENEYMTRYMAKNSMTYPAS